MERKYPKLYLAIDNCFAYKRWTEPDAWARVIAKLGLRYVEGSADTELDPLYMGEEYLADWVKAVRSAEKKYGIRVANLYSGHGTYSTLGLTHTDARVRKRMRELWFKPMIDVAAQLDAGLGFFAHGFPESVLQDGERYAQLGEELLEALSELNCYAREKGCGKLSLEQMYTPALFPWTREGTRVLLKAVRRRSGFDFYFTEDVGHHHMKYEKPSVEQIKKAFVERKKDLWLGSDMAYEIYEHALQKGILTNGEIARIQERMDRNSRFFSGEADADCYGWLAELGCYSPIIHLQQTDGRSSAHKPFTEEENRKGIIEGGRVLRALRACYDAPEESDMPERCQDIYLTLEIFSGTTQTSREILENIKTSVRYWRQFIPEDGISLEEAAEAAGQE